MGNESCSCIVLGFGVTRDYFGLRKVVSLFSPRVLHGFVGTIPYITFRLDGGARLEPTTAVFQDHPSHACCCMQLRTGPAAVQSSVQEDPDAPISTAAARPSVCNRRATEGRQLSPTSSIACTLACPHGHRPAGTLMTRPRAAARLGSRPSCSQLPCHPATRLQRTRLLRTRRSLQPSKIP